MYGLPNKEKEMWYVVHYWEFIEGIGDCLRHHKFMDKEDAEYFATSVNGNVEITKGF
jgi:hypothetical protein